MNGGASGGEVSEVALIADELSRAVELTLNPQVAQEARLQAYNACESFKENSPWCAQAGLLLASGNQYSAVVKHFGLQLMEHTVKYRWTQISQGEKIFIKDNAMKLLYMGGWDTGHLNDALARVIVEMIKREWPQQWPMLLAELSDACSRGHVHTQIVLHVFLRLVEDVATLQTLEQNQRRKDIYQALTSNMAEIFAFFMRLIESHVQEFREKTAAGDFNVAASNERVVQVVLLTLSGFVEWVSTSHIVMNNGRLLQILCILLQDDAFRLPAADCLLQIVNRKGSTKERKPLMILFSEDAISCVHRAAAACINVVDERQYLFLKRLAQVVAGLGQQLVSLWAHAVDTGSWLPGLVETLVVLTQHPSLTVTHITNSVWLSFYKHEHISKLPQLSNAVPRWLQATAHKLLKVNYPASRVNGAYEALTFACMDYDSEKEFNAFFFKFRSELLDSYRQCMTCAPLVTWSFVSRWMLTSLDADVYQDSAIDSGHPVYTEWEALSMVLDVILSRVLTCSPRPCVSEGLQLLQRCVDVRPASPALHSLLLSVISALFVFLSCAYSQLAGPVVGSAGVELLPCVLDRVYSCVTNRTEPVPTRSAAAALRRHAANLLAKLATKYPLLLLPVYNRMASHTRTALSESNLGIVESVTLQEALILVSNHFCNYERQAALVNEIVSPSLRLWPSVPVPRHVGLCVPPVPAGSPDAHRDRRRDVLHAVLVLQGVVRRAAVPDDPDKAMRGGFSAGQTESGNPIWRNPCSASVLSLLPSLLDLTSSLLLLHTQPPTLHPTALKLPAPEHKALIGIDVEVPACDNKGHSMQTFLHTLHDNICLTLGAMASTLGRELYSVPGITGAILNSVVCHLPHLPDHWLRPHIRTSLRSLLHHCPHQYHSTFAIPILEHVAPFMLSHLSQRWEYITRLSESGKLEEEGVTDAQEVLEDMLVRHLSREYMELLKICLVGGPLASEPEEMEEETTGRPTEVSELGGAVLSSGAAGAVLSALVGATAGPDSTASLRATALLQPVVHHLLKTNSLSPSDACAALVALLSGLRAHGQHESNQAALLATALTVYESVYALFPAVTAVLRAVPHVDLNDVQRLEDKLATKGDKPGKHDKGKRELFKKITSKLIGRNVGQLFKKEVLIMNLPQMQTAAREKARGPLEGTGEAAGLDTLFRERP